MILVINHRNKKSLKDLNDTKNLEQKQKYSPET